MGRPSMGEQPLPRQGWSVKGTNRALTQELRLQAIREGRTVGACLNEAILNWLTKPRSTRPTATFTRVELDAAEYDSRMPATIEADEGGYEVEE